MTIDSMTIAEPLANNLLPYTGRTASRLPLINALDVVRFYEMSWLNEKGKPIIGVMEISYYFEDAFSKIDSKSLKDYLNGFASLKFPTADRVVNIITEDLHKQLPSVKLTVNCLEAKDFYSLNTSPHYPELNLKFFDENVRFICKDSRQPFRGIAYIGGSVEGLPYHHLAALINQYRNHVCSIEDYMDGLFSDMQCELNNPFSMVVHLARRGGIGFQMIRSNEPGKNLDMLVKRNHIE